MMSKKKLYLITLITFVALCVFFAVLVNALWYSSDAEVPLPKELQAKKIEDPNIPADIPLSTPVRLVISALHIDAKVQDVGITKNGNMATPNNFTDVGWYKYGALPGEMGSAVIAGHVDDGLALPGVFKHLGDLQK